MKLQLIHEQTEQNQSNSKVYGYRSQVWLVGHHLFVYNYISLFFLRFILCFVYCQCFPIICRRSFFSFYKWTIRSQFEHIVHEGKWLKETVFTFTSKWNIQKENGYSRVQVQLGKVGKVASSLGKRRPLDCLTCYWYRGIYTHGHLTYNYPLNATSLETTHTYTHTHIGVWTSKQKSRNIYLLQHALLPFGWMDDML